MKAQGNSALGMVLIIMLTGGITLHASRDMLTQGMRGVADEQRYIQGFWQAQSALQWGLTLQWPEQPPLFCQQENRYGWQSCLQRTADDKGLLKGEDRTGEMALWRWVRVQGSTIHPLPQGWIDYCPLAASEQCF
ncbi:DUF2509 family protein [Pantoea ananatis]|uniref:DUF2509 family protein n=1 Tax=Pantoea ananas TaxID=553 RepID=A0A8A4K8Y1_PANAN|nr:DUF2509 family protein [Pantoea ananatis]QTC47109.1 DUF2509 family protein [Pantoea ananatis]